MASIILGAAGRAIGTAIGGPIGGHIGAMIGTAVGSMIDNKLFPIKEQGPRLNDLRLQTSSYGKALPLLFGPENRIAGTVIWTTGLIETKKKSKSGGKGAPSVQTTEYTYRASFAVAFSEGEIESVRRIWANGNVIYDVDAPVTSAGIYADLRVYVGNFTQLPDPTIEAYETDPVPAYRGTAYVVFEDLQLADFGNRLPNLEFLVEAQESIEVAEVCHRIVARCGIDTNQVSVAGLNQLVRGFAIGTMSSGIGALQPLALAYDFDVAEVAGGLRLSRRGGSGLGVISREDLAGREGSAEGGNIDHIRWARLQVTALPREANVTFLDPDRDWQVNSQRAMRSEGSADSNLSTEIALVLTVDDARRLADRMLWEAWTGMQTAETQMNDRWIGIQPGRSYYFTSPGGIELLRVIRATRGANGVIDLALARDRDEVYLSTATGAGSVVPPNEFETPGEATAILLDIPLLLDGDEPSATGFYWGVIGSGPGWRGADFNRAPGVTGVYANVSPQGLSLTAGEADTILPAPAGGFDSAVDWDLVSTVTVTLDNPDMALESMTDDEVLAGGNACMIGALPGRLAEILQFGVATIIDPVTNTWTLSRLRRGQRGTEFAWDDHLLTDRFILLEPGNVQRADFGVSDLNVTNSFKAISLLTTDGPVVAFANTGVGLRPYSPKDLVAEGLTGPGDIQLDWTRRSRIGNDLIPPPLAETTESYILRIMNAGGTIIEREVALTAPSFLYTAAMQIADFGSVRTSLRWRVGQVSEVFGLGILAEKSGPV